MSTTGAGGDEHAQAAGDAASSAAGATPAPGAGGSAGGGGADRPPPTADNAHLESFKQVAMTDPGVQNELSGATSEDDFLHRAVAAAKRFNLHFTHGEAKAHMQELQQHDARKSTLSAEASAEVAAEPAGSRPAVSAQAGCSSQGTSSGAYSLNCGFSTQKCLCTI